MALERSFQWKTVIVTGAGRGIGRALTKRLDSLGAKVYAVSKNVDSLASLKSECGQIETIAVDLRDWQATRDAIQNINTNIDYLVNCAATIIPGQFLGITADDLDSLFSVNFRAVVNVNQVVARKMIQAGKGGAIVNMSSVAAIKACTTVSAYGCLKSALDQLTKVMAVELGPFGIRVNSVNPAAVNRSISESELVQFMSRVDSERMQEEGMRRIPMKKHLIEVDEVVNAVLFCLSDLAPSVTGVILPVDGGLAAN